MGISNLSLSALHEYHHPDSLQITNGKDRSKQQFSFANLYVSVT
jgi:hypothetical protein